MGHPCSEPPARPQPGPPQGMYSPQPSGLIWLPPVSANKVLLELCHLCLSTVPPVAQPPARRGAAARRAKNIQSGPFRKHLLTPGPREPAVSGNCPLCTEGRQSCSALVSTRLSPSPQPHGQSRVLPAPAARPCHTRFPRPLGLRDGGFVKRTQSCQCPHPSMAPSGEPETAGTTADRPPSDASWSHSRSRSSQGHCVSG